MKLTGKQLEKQLLRKRRRRAELSLERSLARQKIKEERQAEKITNKYNLFFCLDEGFLFLIPYVFRTFIKNNDPRIYHLHFITYNIKDTNQIKKTLLDIHKGFTITIKPFHPDQDFIDSLTLYNELIQKTPGSKKDHSVKTFQNVGNWSRFFISELFPHIDYGLYLDLDILFNESIYPLITDKPTKNIVGIIPYNKETIINRDMFKSNNLDEKIIKQFSLDINSYKTTFSYNCGVIYFNLKLWKKNKLTNKIRNFIKYCVKHDQCILLSGTELIQNILVPHYKSYEKKYNMIQSKKKRKITDFNFSIAHFKGHSLYQIKGRQMNKYKNAFNKIISL